MHIIAFTRSTPDTAANVTVDDSGKVVWDGANIVNPWDEYALEEAIAQARAEERRAMAVAQEQEMRANVVEAEAQVPLALAEALRTGNLGVMDHYRMQNVRADTEMRSSIAGDDDR